MSGFKSMRSVITLVPFLMLAGCGVGSSGHGSIKHVVQIRYTVAPQQGLPPGLKSVAVLPAEVTPATDPIWSDLASSIVQRVMREACDTNRLKLDVVARRETPKILAEQDLAAAGLVHSDRPGAPVAMQAIEGFITSKVDVIVEQAVGTSTTISGIDISGLLDRDRTPKSRYIRTPSGKIVRVKEPERRGGGVDVQTREAEKVVRTMTVSTTFKLIDSVTGKEWDSETSVDQGTEEEKPSFFFGRDKSMADLTPKDKIIGTLVERAARKFINRIVPTQVSVEVPLKSSSHESSIAGVKALRGDRYEEALADFRTALEADPSDYRSTFGAGVTCELMGRYEEALDYYRTAAAESDREEYVQAKSRLSRHLEHLAPNPRG